MVTHSPAYEQVCDVESKKRRHEKEGACRIPTLIRRRMDMRHLVKIGISLSGHGIADKVP